METKHTPGPWIAEKWDRLRWMVTHPDGIVCITAAGNDEGNARLMAAAPDLLLALEEAAPRCNFCAGVGVWVLSHYEDDFACDHHKGCLDERAQMCGAVVVSYDTGRMVAAAIARATGDA